MRSVKAVTYGTPRTHHLLSRDCDANHAEAVNRKRSWFSNAFSDIATGFC